MSHGRAECPACRYGTQTKRGCEEDQPVHPDGYDQARGSISIRTTTPVFSYEQGRARGIILFCKGAVLAEASKGGRSLEMPGLLALQHAGCNRMERYIGLHPALSTIPGTEEERDGFKMYSMRTFRANAPADKGRYEGSRANARPAGKLRESRAEERSVSAVRTHYPEVAFQLCLLASAETHCRPFP